MKNALFFDIDGTLVDDKNVIPESALRGIREARRKNSLVFINSGRCLKLVLSVASKIEHDGLLCGCGTDILVSGKKEELYEIPRPTRKRIIEAVDKYNVDIFSEARDGNRSSRYLDSRFPEIREGIEFVKLLGGFIPDGFFDPDNPFSKFCVQADNESDMMGFKSEFRKEFDIMDRRGGFFECVPLGFTKGTAVNEVLKLYGIDPDHAYVFGDSSNDLAMFQTDAHGIAMGQHDPVLDPFTEYVTTDLEDDGIYNALKHYDLI